MTEEEYIDKQLETYGEAFDFYMDYGRMPDTMAEDDVLGNYMQRVFDDNPQLNSQDALWKEVLRDNLMAFLNVMLHAFLPIDRFHDEQEAMMEAYGAGNIEKKRAMWHKVYQNLKNYFTPEEVNIDGYVKQFNGQDNDAIQEAIVRDWQKANDKQRQRKKQQLLEQQEGRLESHLKDCGKEDFEQRKKVERMFYHYPALKDIVRMIGREQPQRKDEEDEIVQKFIPLIRTYPNHTTEREEINVGNDLSRIIPLEIAFLADKDIEMLFYYKYAASQLQQFANRPPTTSQLKKEQLHINRPRLEMGPIIVSIDTSGSMNGTPERLAKCLLMQLLKMAKKKKRKCFLITFSVRAKSIELTTPRNWASLQKFLREGFSGGTDGEQMFHSAIKALQSKDFSMADVLVISDFCFPLPLASTRKQLAEERGKGTRFYGLQIGKQKCQYETELDKMWKI